MRYYRADSNACYVFNRKCGFRGLLLLFYLWLSTLWILGNSYQQRYVDIRTVSEMSSRLQESYV